MRRVVKWIETHTSRPSAPKEERRRCTFTFAYVAVTLVMMQSLLLCESKSAMLVYTYFFTMAWMVFTLIWLLTQRQASTTFIGLVAVMSTMSVALVDVGMAALGLRVWPMFVLLVDWLLIVRAPLRMAAALVAGVVFYLLAVEVELTFRLGLLDMPGSFDYAHRRKHMECDKPPCARNDVMHLTTMTSCLPQAYVFSIHFLLTRHFADALRGVEAQNEAGRDAVDHVAGCLARFDLAGAQYFLDQRGVHLPTAVRTHYASLLDNLVAYRPYLPQFLLPEDEEQEVPDKAVVSTASATPLQATLAPQDKASLGGAAGISPASCWMGSPLRSLPGTPGDPLPVPRLAIQTMDGDESNGQPASSPSLTQSDSGSSKSSAPSTPRGPPRHHRAAGMRERIASENMRVQNIAVLHVTFSFTAGHLSEYVRQHEECLAAALPMVAECRGVLDSLDGSTMCMSFNAFKPAARYSVAAINVALRISSELSTHAPSGVLVAGPASVGYLGTSCFRRPAVIGGLIPAARQLAAVGAVTCTRWLCSSHIYDDAYLDYKMRIVLHRVFLDTTVSTPPGHPTFPAAPSHVDDHEPGAKDPPRRRSLGSSAFLSGLASEGRGQVVVYELESTAQAAEAPLPLMTPGAGTNHVFPTTSFDWEDEAQGIASGRADERMPPTALPLKHRGVNEWIYTISHAGGQELETYNDAGKKMLTRGHHSAAKHLLVKGAHDNLKSAFAHAVQAMRVIDLTPRVCRDADMRMQVEEPLCPAECCAVPSDFLDTDHLRHH